MATTIQLKTPKLPARKAAAVKRRAAELGFTLEEYLKHLIEDDLAISDAARSTSLADLAAPFREALAGISGRELDQRVKAAPRSPTHRIGTPPAVTLPHSNQFGLVIDTNVLVRGLANRASASGRLLQLCEDRLLRMFLSREIILEYRDVLSRKELTRQHPAITPEVVAVVIDRLRYIADVIDAARVHFEYERDPDDECFIELAIAAGATHIVTNDNDLLSLPHEHTDAGKRFRQRLPSLRVVRPSVLLREFETSQRVL